MIASGGRPRSSRSIASLEQAKCKTETLSDDGCSYWRRVRGEGRREWRERRGEVGWVLEYQWRVTDKKRDAVCTCVWWKIFAENKRFWPGRLSAVVQVREPSISLAKEFFTLMISTLTEVTLVLSSINDTATLSPHVRAPWQAFSPLWQISGIPLYVVFSSNIQKVTTLRKVQSDVRLKGTFSWTEGDLQKKKQDSLWSSDVASFMITW